MSDQRASAIPRGETFYGPSATIPTTYGTSVLAEGIPRTFPDTNPSNRMHRRSNNDVYAIQVRNVSGITLKAGQIVTWAAGYRGKRVDGLSCVTMVEVAGVVDDHVPSGGVRNGDIFNLIVRGPCNVLLSRTAAEAVITAADILYAVTAATSGATTAGRFTNWVGTWTATEATDGTATKLALNRLGRAISAATTADTGAARLVDLEIR